LLANGIRSLNTLHGKIDTIVGFFIANITLTYISIIFLAPILWQLAHQNIVNGIVVIIIGCLMTGIAWYLSEKDRTNPTKLSHVALVVGLTWLGITLTLSPFLS
jgi:hypothetical protein